MLKKQYFFLALTKLSSNGHNLRVFLLCFYFFNLVLIKFLNFKLMLIFFYSFDGLKEKYLLSGMEKLAGLLIFTKWEKLAFSFSFNFQLLFQPFLVSGWVFLFLFFISFLIFCLFLVSIILKFFFNLVRFLLGLISWGLSFFLSLRLFNFRFIFGLKFIFRLG